jgi:hypothetical protein
LEAAMASTTFPSGTPRVVGDDQYEVLSAAWAADGIIGAIGDPNLVYADASGRQVKFRAGMFAQIHGHGWSSGSADIVKAVAANGTGQPRIDLAVLGLDRATWQVSEYIKTGTASATPVAPTLVRDVLGTGTGKWEIPVGQIAVAAGASVINASDVTPISSYLTSGSVVVPDAATLARLPTPPYGTVVNVVDMPYLYSSAGWRRVDWNTAWGAVGNPVSTAVAGPAGGYAEGRDSALGNFVFTAPAGRRHLTKVTGLQLSGTVGELYLYFVRDGGPTTPPASGGTLVVVQRWFCPATGGAGQMDVPALERLGSYTAGVHTLSLFTSLNTGSHPVTPLGNRQMIVYDMGPA